VRVGRGTVFGGCVKAVSMGRVDLILLYLVVLILVAVVLFGRGQCCCSAGERDATVGPAADHRHGLARLRSHRTEELDASKFTQTLRRLQEPSGSRTGLLDRWSELELWAAANWSAVHAA